MDAEQLTQAVAGAVTAGARTRVIFGEPITAQGRTVVPVARIAFGFGSGAGVEPEEHGEEAGGGAGGGVNILNQPRAPARGASLALGAGLVSFPYNKGGSRSIR